MVEQRKDEYSGFAVVSTDPSNAPPNDAEAGPSSQRTKRHVADRSEECGSDKGKGRARMKREMDA